MHGPQFTVASCTGRTYTRRRQASLRLRLRFAVPFFVADRDRRIPGDVLRAFRRPRPHYGLVHKQGGLRRFLLAQHSLLWFKCNCDRALAAHYSDVHVWLVQGSSRVALGGGLHSVCTHAGDGVYGLSLTLGPEGLL